MSDHNCTATRVHKVANQIVNLMREAGIGIAPSHEAMCALMLIVYRHAKVLDPTTGAKQPMGTKDFARLVHLVLELEKHLRDDHGLSQGETA